MEKFRTFDTVIAHGNIVDGLGTTRRDMDVGIADGKIAKIAPGGSLHGVSRVDAREAYVTPGFIDIHSHADYTVMLDGRAHSA